MIERLVEGRVPIPKSRTTEVVMVRFNRCEENAKRELKEGGGEGVQGEVKSIAKRKV